MAAKLKNCRKLELSELRNGPFVNIGWRVGLVRNANMPLYVGK